MLGSDPYIYIMDHYDAYTYVAIGAVSFLSALLFILLNLKFKEARKFPSNLLIFASFAELFLTAHWFVSGLYTPFILGVPAPEEDSLFCKANSVVAFFFANVEFLFHVSFVLSIIVTFKNTLHTLKAEVFFWLLPLLAAVIALGFAFYKDLLGRNIYGTCSLRQMKKTGRSYIIINGTYVFLSLYALWVLKKFMAMERQKIYFKDDFYSSYINYIILVIALYLILGTNYVLSGYIMKCLDAMPGGVFCYKVYFFSKITNTVKIFMPLLAFLVRIRDPFYLKLVYSWLVRRERKKEQASMIHSQTGLNQSLLEEEPSYVVTEDFGVNNQLKEVKKGIVRTIVHGIYEYFGSWVNTLDESSDNSFIEKVEMVLRGNDVINESSVLGFTAVDQDNQTFECSVSSIGALTFKSIIGQAALQNIDISFRAALNRKQIEGCSIDGGAGGEFMMFTYDRRYMIKTLQEEELGVLRSILPNYQQHFAANPRSFITRIVGAFSFDFKKTGQRVHVFVMEFVFHGVDKLLFRKYDLKGSKHKRNVLDMRKSDLVLLKRERRKETLKDIDFKEIDRSIRFEPRIRNFLVNQLTEDSRFFWDNKLMDYSLLIGLIEVGQLSVEERQILDAASPAKVFYSQDRSLAIVLGIIDYFQKYNWQKYFEKHGKRVQNCSCELDTSAQSPDFYSERFVEFMKKIFV